MQYLYLGLFIGVTTWHLYCSLKQNAFGRGISKGMILLLLLGFYLESVATPQWTIVAALLFSWLGDVLLIGKGTAWFTAGGIAFMISHGFFIAGYCEFIVWENVPLWLIIALGVFFAAAVTFIFSRLKKYLNKALIVPMFVYLLINGAMNSFALFRFISGISLGTVITVIGALLFFASDTALFFVRFNKNSIQKSHFFVMLTYSLGELLIVLGLILA